MKIKKLEKLQDLLDKDMAWRKKELIDINCLSIQLKIPLYVELELHCSQPILRGLLNKQLIIMWYM